ncbi:MAG: hypothetical protein IK020_10470 [Clostridiales bacterium]|nr:hypothetical protein [Clostridiales bacterium]
MELNLKNAKTTFFRVQLIVGILALFASFVLFTMFEPALGEYLTKSAIESLRTNEILRKVFVATMVIWIGMMLSCLATLYLGKSIIPAGLIGLVVLIAMFFLIRAVPYIIHKPQVLKMSCVSRDSTYTGDEYHESFTYTLVFENGMSCNVSEDAYMNSVQHTYWVIIVGNEAVAAYKTEEYTWIEGY